MRWTRGKRRIVVILTACALLSAACSGSGGGSSPGGSSALGGASSTTPAGAKPGAKATDAAEQANAPSASTAAYTPTGQLIADDGFRPEKDSFAFENYGDLPPGDTNLTADDMRKMFGDGVCADLSNGTCNLLPPAQQWMDDNNSGMIGGHCQGFAALVQELWSGFAKPVDFGADATPALKIDNNTNLSRAIAFDWAYQSLDSVQAGVIEGTPNDIIAKLKTALVPNPPETYELSIRKRDNTGGHAITPYAIEDKGGGLLNILVYDNNYPGVTRAVEVDTNANTWKYDAATNPSNPSEVYEGDADTKTMRLRPNSPAHGVQPCPFCATVGAAAAGGSALGTANDGGVHLTAVRTAGEAPAMDEITLDASDTDHAHLLISDGAGHQLGFVKGQQVSTIPGGKAVVSDADSDWNARPEPTYYVPDGPKYTITLDATSMQSPDNEGIDIIGPSSEFSASEINVEPNDVDTLVYAKDATEATYTASRPDTPVFDVGVSDETADWTFTVSGVSDQAGSTTALRLPAEGTTFSVDTSGSSGTSTLDLSVKREDSKGVINFKHDGITLGAGDNASVDFSGFDSASGTLPLTITQGGQAQPPEQLNNQD